MRAHKSLRRWVVALLIFYGLLMLMSLPGSRRRIQVCLSVCLCLQHVVSPFYRVLS